MIEYASHGNFDGNCWSVCKHSGVILNAGSNSGKAPLQAEGDHHDKPFYYNSTIPFLNYKNNTCFFYFLGVEN
jgi:hypothetical protein